MVEATLLKAHTACQKLIETRETHKVFDAKQYELVLMLMAEAWLAGGNALAREIRDGVGV